MALRYKSGLFPLNDNVVRTLTCMFFLIVKKNIKSFYLYLKSLKAVRDTVNHRSTYMFVFLCCKPRRCVTFKA